MKKGLAVVISVVGVLLAAGAMAGGGYLMFKNTTEKIGPVMKNIQKGDVVEVQSVLEPIESITINGFWKVKVVRGTAYSIVASVPSDATTSFYKLNGKNLKLGIGKFGDFSVQQGVAEITVKDLKEISVEGGSEISFSELDEEYFELHIEGASKVAAYGCNFENLEILSEGAGSIDFTESYVTNANLNLDGLSTTKIHMNGGFLDVEINGAGTVHYSGEVSETHIERNGLATVKRIE